MVTKIQLIVQAPSSSREGLGIIAENEVTYNLPARVGSYYNVHSTYQSGSNLDDEKSNVQVTIAYNRLYCTNGRYPVRVILEGQKWKVTNYEIKKPKLILTLGAADASN